MVFEKNSVLTPLTCHMPWQHQLRHEFGNYLKTYTNTKCKKYASLNSIVLASSTRNKWKCAIFDLNSSTTKSGNLRKIETQNSGNLKHKGFLLNENTQHPDKKIFDMNSTFQFYLFYQRILLFHFCFTTLVPKSYKFSSTAGLNYDIGSAFQN